MIMSSKDLTHSISRAALLSARSLSTGYFLGELGFWPPNIELGSNLEHQPIAAPAAKIRHRTSEANHPAAAQYLFRAICLSISVAPGAIKGNLLLLQEDREREPKLSWQPLDHHAPVPTHLRFLPHTSAWHGRLLALPFVLLIIFIPHKHLF